MEFERGQTGVVVAFPDAGPAITRVRHDHDPAAAVGVPPHVTVTFPFLAQPVLTDGDLSALADIATAEPAFEVRFAATGRFPGVTFLRPEPDGPFRSLTAALLSRWPHVLPYGGEFGPEPEPHLTVATSTTDSVLADVASQLLGSLPITLDATGLAVLFFDGARWSQRLFFQVGAPASAPYHSWPVTTTASPSRTVGDRSRSSDSLP